MLTKTELAKELLRIAGSLLSSKQWPEGSLFPNRVKAEEAVKSFRKQLEDYHSKSGSQTKVRVIDSGLVNHYEDLSTGHLHVDQRAEAEPYQPRPELDPKAVAFARKAYTNICAKHGYKPEKGQGYVGTYQTNSRKGTQQSFSFDYASPSESGEGQGDTDAHTRGEGWDDMGGGEYARGEGW